MKRLFIAATLAGLLMPSFAALADGHRHHDSGYYYEHGYEHGYDDDDDDRRHHHRKHKHKHKHHRDYRRGERIEVVYLEPRYYVEDYDHYHLRRPPSGHRWVRTDDGRLILVAVATGIIADILLHH